MGVFGPDRRNRSTQSCSGRRGLHPCQEAAEDIAVSVRLFDHGEMGAVVEDDPCLPGPSPCAFEPGYPAGLALNEQSPLIPSAMGNLVARCPAR
jgi:hypothetical protein